MSHAARAFRCAALASLLSACAATGSKQATTGSPPSALPRVEPARIERLRRLAPDFLARAERANDRARRAETAEIAAEHADCAALLLEAAEREADRIELERALLAEALRRDAAVRALAAERYALLALDSQAAIARASTRDASAGDSPKASQRTAAELVRRARLQLATARALGAEPGRLADAERQLRRAIERPEQARAALELADRILERTRATR